MANFSPLNDYILYIFDKIIPKYNLKPPFLDAGCGTGYVSKYLASKGWAGKAIDLSSEAINICKKELSHFSEVKVAKQGILNQKEKFSTIIMIDVIEHLKNDDEVLRKISSILTPNGYIILAFTSNPKEWRWDDDFYGHYRRYTEKDIKRKLKRAGLEPEEFIEYTFPSFWLIRRIYTSFQKPTVLNFKNKAKRTDLSSTSSSWNVSPIFRQFMGLKFFWKIIFYIQFHFFKRFTTQGFATLVVAKKSFNTD